MINYSLNSFQGMMTFGSINSMKLLEVSVTSSSVTPTFYGAFSTNTGMIFVKDIANSQTNSFSFVNVPLANCGKVLGYVASTVYYFYYAYGNTIGLYSTGSSTTTHTYVLDSNIVGMDLTGTTLYVATQANIYQFSIGALGVLTQSAIFQTSQVLSIAAISSTVAFVGLKTGGYALRNFSSPSYVYSSGSTIAFKFEEVVVNNGYIVGSDYNNIYTELISTINTGLQTITSLQNLNINNATTIRNLDPSQSGVVTFHSGNGIATFTASTNTVASFLNQSALGNQVLQKLSWFSVTSDGVSFLVGNGNNAYIYKQYEKIYTWGTGNFQTQSIFRFYQGRLKILAMFPTDSTANATVNLFDENGIALDSWTVASGLVTNSGVYGVGTHYCYFDAPLGLTNQSFQFQVVGSSATEIVKVYLEEVAQ